MSNQSLSRTPLESNPNLFNYQDPHHLQLLLEIRPYKMRTTQYLYNRFIKRLFDFVLAFLGLLFLLPLFLVLAILIKKESPGPVFFRQKRVGRESQIFAIVKFRTMFIQAPSEVSTTDLRDSASYITKVGAFLRRTSLDELPQLWNVIRGEMALVGPRPLIRKEADMDYLRNKNGIYQLRPGITGWAQVKGRDFVTVGEKIGYDRDYLQGLSFTLDVRILYETVRSVLKKETVAF